MTNFNIGDVIKDIKSKDERAGVVVSKRFFPDFEDPEYTIDIIQTKTNNMAGRTIRVYGANDWVLCHGKEEFDK